MCAPVLVGCRNENFACEPSQVKSSQVKSSQVKSSSKMAPSTTSPAGRSTGARYREGAFLRNLLGLVAPFSGIIHVYFFLRGATSQAANFGHFPFRTVQCNAASWLSVNRGGFGAARGLVLLPGCPSSGDYRRRLLPRARGAPISSFAPFEARQGPDSFFELVWGVNFF